jgi:alkylation response protein AidB-like acyl-CoA dehydrogenase
MDFSLSEEQEMLQETVRGFVAGECPPSRLREIFDAGTGTDDAVWQGLIDMGLAGLLVPEAYGGAEMELLDLALATEVLGGGALPGPLLGHSLTCLALVSGGSDSQKSKWLPQLAEGGVIGSVALCEERDRWDPTEWNAEIDGDRLTGSKRFVPSADLAHLLVVGAKGGGLVLVEAGAPGVEIKNMGGIDQTRPIFEIHFDGAACEPLERGTEAAGRLRDGGLVLMAADSFGAATELVRMSVEYAKAREQFGQPIAQFQAVKHQLARLATDIEPTRALYWYAAYAFDHLPDESEHSAAMAKAHITDRAVAAAREAVELHGGLGFTWECDVQMWFKRAMFNRAFLGTPEVQRERCAVLGGW